MNATAQRLWDICRDCAQHVYTVQPSAEYADRVARLLLGTAAQESGFVWERQRAPRWSGGIGGFSKWQVETGSIQDSIKMLRENPTLAERSTMFLFQDPHADLSWLDMPLDAILWAMRMDDNDKLGCLFARLHYLRKPGAIPEDNAQRAIYWKQHYNTVCGAGTTGEYRENWELRCRETVEGR